MPCAAKCSQGVVEALRQTQTLTILDRTNNESAVAVTNFLWQQTGLNLLWANLLL